MKKLICLLLALAMVFTLAACGGKKGPTAEDARKYVKAVLDGICTGEHDPSVQFSDVDDMTQLRDETVEAVIDAFASQGIELYDETSYVIRDAMLAAFAKCKYQVGDAVAVENGYDVSVTISPLMLYNFDTEQVQQEAVTALLAETSDPDSLSDTDVLNRVFQMMFQQVILGLETPEYADDVTLTVRYQPLEDNMYGVSEEDGFALGQAVFYAG